MDNRVLEILEYDKEWPVIYAEEEVVLQKILKPSLLEVHHVGSTSVPGMAAKPIIDILCIMHSGTDIASYNVEMIRHGYEARGECLDAAIPGTPGRYYFPKIEGGRHLIHVHVCHEKHPQIKELLQLRDYLKSNPEDANRYSQLKLSLVAKYPTDIVQYMKGKAPLINELILKAQTWSREGI